MKLLYKPLGFVVSVLGGILASAVRQGPGEALRRAVPSVDAEAS